MIGKGRARILNEYNINLKLEKPKNISENIYDILSQAIIFGKFKAGQTINATFIANKMGVSRTPLREAFKRLEQEGWIESLSNGRKRVKKTSLGQAIEIYDIRSVLEPYLIELVCKNITDNELEKLEKIIKEGISYLHNNKDNKLEKILNVNKRFNMQLYKIAGNKKLCTILSSLYDNILHYRIFNLRNVAYEKRSVDEHREILEALKKRDVVSAKKIVRNHIEIAKELVIRGCVEGS
jgi:DNA-binding GntR family transcriptional regulator